MAIFYYPKGSKLAQKNAWDPYYEMLILADTPNTVFYFDTGSGLNAASASMLDITSSWAQTASVTIQLTSTTTSVSSSYAQTASIALNALGGGGGGGFAINSSSFTTIVTGSGQWITASFNIGEQYVTLTTASIYNFTCSSLPISSSAVAFTTLFISHSANRTSSLNFPSDWIFIGSEPISITSSRCAMLSLRAYNPGPIVAAFALQY